MVERLEASSQLYRSIQDFSHFPNQAKLKVTMESSICRYPLRSKVKLTMDLMDSLICRYPHVAQQIFEYVADDETDMFHLPQVCKQWKEFLYDT